MIDLKDYGKTVKRHTGTGTVIDEDTRTRGRYRFVQYVDGRMILEHTSSQVILRPGYDPLPLNRDYSFEGKTAEGYTIEARSLGRFTSSFVLPMIRPGERTRKPKSTQRYRCQTITIGSDSVSKPRQVRFSLINLDIHSRKMVLDIGGTQMLLRPVDNAKELIDVIKAIRGFDVTCEVVIAIESLDELPMLQRKVEDVCLLLTLARGTIVTWINYTVVGEQGELITSTCHDSYTRSFGLLYLIAPSDHDSTKRFIESTYTQLERCTTEWDIQKVIRAYVEARSESDVLEGRGIKLAICMEILRTQFLERRGETYIMSPKIFDPATPELQRSFREILRTTFPEIEDLKLDLVLKHISPGLNYYPFRRALREMCRTVQLFPNSKAREAAIGEFLDLRNDLVHRGKFPVDGRPAVEYFVFLDELVGKFLVAALGYDVASLRPALRDFVPQRKMDVSPHHRT